MLAGRKNTALLPFLSNGHPYPIVALTFQQKTGGIIFNGINLK